MPTLSSVQRLLDVHLPPDADGAWYRTPAIPIKKLKNAIRTYAESTTEDCVLALGDGTVFGSAKEGILITDETLFSRTTDGAFAIPLQSLASAKVIAGWPGYNIELQCRDGSTHGISMSCFQKKQAPLVDFVNALAAGEISPAPRQSSAPPEADVRGRPTKIRRRQPTTAQPETTTTIGAVNAGLKLISICHRDPSDDINQFLDNALRSESERPLLRGYCRYVGFNGREVDGVFLLSNQRLLLYSMESGAKIVFVELTRRLLGKLPVPFLDKIGCFLLFSIPRAAYVALRGGREALITKALAAEEQQLLSGHSPLRKIQEYDVSLFRENIAQVDVGEGIWTGMLSRKFGVSFAPTSLAKTFRLPKDMILPEQQSLEPIEQLLSAVRATLLRLGLDYQLDTKSQKLTVGPKTVVQEAAA